MAEESKEDKVDRSRFIVEKKVSEAWRQRVWSKEQKPVIADRGIGLACAQGILGYGIPSDDGTGFIDFKPLVFQSEVRAEGLCKAIRNRTTIEHAPLLVMGMDSVWIGATTRVEDVKETGVIPPDGPVARRMIRAERIKRGKAAREARDAAFIGDD